MGLRKWGGVSSQAGSSLPITVEPVKCFLKGLRQYSVASKLSYVIKIRVYKNLILHSLSEETVTSEGLATS